MNRNSLDNNLSKYLRRHTLNASVSLVAIIAAQHTALAQTAAPLTPVPDISVTSPAPGKPAEGSEAAGYKPETVANFGPFGQMPILDVPYSVNVISSDLIENRVAPGVDEVFKISPTTKLESQRDWSYSPLFSIRGFGANLYEDGLIINTTYPNSLEDKERVEIYSGLTSFLFGPTVVGGAVNFVEKRPTLVPIANVTIGDYEHLAGYIHGDFGGPISIAGLPDGMFAYRLNIVAQDGNTAVDHASTTRELITAALDWHVTANTTVSLIGSVDNEREHYLCCFWSPQAYSTAAGGALKFNYSFVPNPSTNYSQPYFDEAITKTRTGIDVTSKLNDIFSTRLAYRFTNEYVPTFYLTNNDITDSVGDYFQAVNKSNGSRYQVQSGYGYLDAHFDTWSIEHKLTMGYYGNIFSTQRGAGSTNTVDTNMNIFNGQPLNNTPPALTTSPSYFGLRYTASNAGSNNYIVGDEIKFNQYLSALVGANYAEIIAQNFNTTIPFSESSYVDQGKLSPTLSLIFKPVPWLSTYATYSQALEQGQIVPASGAIIYTNSGQVLAPVTDEEFEIGAKANVGGMLLTGALFNINKANQFAQINSNGTETYVQDGREIHKGIELTATGNVMEGLRLLGGVTFLAPQVEQTASVTTNNKYPVNVSNQMVKSTMEYDLPFAPGLTLTGGVYYNGKAPADALNSAWVPAYTTEDLGLRYRTHLPTGQEAIFRLNVSNLTNKAYWLASNYVGEPRVIAFSTQIKF